MLVEILKKYLSKLLPNTTPQPELTTVYLRLVIASEFVERVCEELHRALICQNNVQIVITPYIDGNPQCPSVEICNVADVRVADSGDRRFVDHSQACIIVEVMRFEGGEFRTLPILIGDEVRLYSKSASTYVEFFNRNVHVKIKID